MKSGCDWIHVGHDKVDCAEVIAKVKARAGSVGALVIKFEPFILHVQCRDLEAAKRLHTAAVEAGYRDADPDRFESNILNYIFRPYFDILCFGSGHFSWINTLIRAF